MMLRQALQSLEQGGFVEYTLGGHMCVRPVAVQQGKEDDKFDISPESENPLVWRPNVIAQKNLKAANIASHFSFGQLEASPLVLDLRLAFVLNGLLRLLVFVFHFIRFPYLSITLRFGESGSTRRTSWWQLRSHYGFSLRVCLWRRGRARGSSSFPS